MLVPQRANFGCTKLVVGGRRGWKLADGTFHDLASKQWFWSRATEAVVLVYIERAYVWVGCLRLSFRDVTEWLLVEEVFWLRMTKQGLRMWIVSRVLFGRVCNIILEPGPEGWPIVESTSLRLGFSVGHLPHFIHCHLLVSLPYHQRFSALCSDTILKTFLLIMQKSGIGSFRMPLSKVVAFPCLHAQLVGLTIHCRIGTHHIWERDRLCGVVLAEFVVPLRDSDWSKSNMLIDWWTLGRLALASFNLLDDDSSGERLPFFFDVAKLVGRYTALPLALVWLVHTICFVHLSVKAIIMWKF